MAMVEIPYQPGQAPENEQNTHSVQSVLQIQLLGAGQQAHAPGQLSCGGSQDPTGPL